MTDKLSILFWNARDILSKREELSKYVQSKQLDIVCVCESFLKGERTMIIRGYNTVRVNRATARLGGLILFIKKELKFKEIIFDNLKILECLGITIDAGSSSLNFILLYLPGQKSDSDIKALFKLDLDNITQKHKDFFIIGDYNARSTHFFPPEHTYCPPSSLMKPSTIDLIVTDGKFQFSDPFTVNEFSSDHLPVRFSVYVHNLNRTNETIFNYRQTNWKLYRTAIR